MLTDPEQIAALWSGSFRIVVYAARAGPDRPGSVAPALFSGPARSTTSRSSWRFNAIHAVLLETRRSDGRSRPLTKYARGKVVISS